MPHSHLKPDFQTHTFRLPEPYNTQMKDKLRARSLSLHAYIETLVLADLPNDPKCDTCADLKLAVVARRAIGLIIEQIGASPQS